jgi:hypothetical protein
MIWVRSESGLSSMIRNAVPILACEFCFPINECNLRVLQRNRRGYRTSSSASDTELNGGCIRALLAPRIYFILHIEVFRKYFIHNSVVDLEPFSRLHDLKSTYFC